MAKSRAQFCAGEANLQDRRMDELQNIVRLAEQRLIASHDSERLYDRRVDELEGMVKNLTAQTHHLSARYDTDTRSALRNAEQLHAQLASEAMRHQAAVARIDELIAENSHYKLVYEAMKMEAQEFLVKVKLDIASAAFAHRKGMDERAATVAAV